MIKTIKYFFEALFIYIFFLVGKLIGLSLSRNVFSFIFKKIGPLIKSKTIISKNLDILPGNISLEKKSNIISNMWSNYGMTFIEYIFLNHFKNNSSHIDIEGEKILLEISKKNKPVIFFSGHFANFELMSMEITKKNIKLATIYRPLNNFFLNPFMEYLRRTYVCKNQIKKGVPGVKKSIEYLKQNHSIALMIDQRVSEGEKVNFFGKLALTTTLPAQLAIKYNLDLVPIFIERENENIFKMRVFEPIKTSNFENKLKVSEKLNRVLESMIVKNPNQWIWTHNRWK